MATAASLTLDVWRNDEVYEFPLRVRGPDLTGPNEIVHPQLLGHQVSYQRCIREFVAASRRGYGDQWCFRGKIDA